MELLIQPRLQVETHSLYWKASMRTDTKCLERIAMRQLDPDTPMAKLCQEAAGRLGWAPVSGLHRLEGFDGKWERVLFKGRELAEDATLASAGLRDGDVVTLVRVQLNAEGWRIAGDVDSAESDSE